MAKRNVVDFKIINLSEEKFQELKEAGQIDPNALYTTPDTTKERLDALEGRATSLETKTTSLEAITENLETKTELLENDNGILKWNGINMSAMGLPSDKYIDLPLGAPGGSYKAPADGYLVIRKTATAANQYVYMKSGEIFTSSHATSNDTVLEMYVPVQGGKSCVVSYNAGGSTGVFRFVYAEGAKYLA